MRLDWRPTQTPYSFHRVLVRRRQPQSSNDALEIVRSVVINLDSPAFVSVMDGDMGGQMLLQPVLQIFNCRCRGTGIGDSTPRFSPPAPNTKQASNHSLGGTNRGVASQNCFGGRSEERRVGKEDRCRWVGCGLVE